MAAGGGPDVVDMEAALRELYAVEPAEFVTARAELVRLLRAAKRREEAAAVAKRRRPSPPAWALDKVAREQPELIERALAAGVGLRAATEVAMAGDAAELRRATAEDRAASDAVVDAAAGHLGSRGPAARSPLTATLRAAVLDEEVAAELRQGVLATEHDAPGFGWSGFEVPVAPASVPSTRAEAPAKKSKAKGRRPAPDEQPDAEAEAETARERAAREREEREEAERRERRARAEAELAELEEQAAELARRAEQAEAEARQARAAADDAAEAVRAAQAELDRTSER